MTGIQRTSRARALSSLATSALSAAALTLSAFGMFVASPASTASAAYLVGNGGGAWVCRTAPGVEIWWAQTVDLFEARAQFTVRDFGEANAEDILAQMGARLKEIDPWLAQAFWARYARVREAWTPVSNMQLEVIDDALYYGKPAPESCAQSVVTYEQVVNFYPDGTVFADTRILQALSEIDRAALYAHEALYLLFREMFGDTNSVRTRKTVALLFSTKETDELLAFFDWYRPLAYVPVLAPQFDSLGEFSEGLAPALRAARWGYVSTTGRFVVPNRYLETRSFHAGLGAVRTAEGWGFVDAKGALRVKPAFEEVSDFNASGLAAAKSGGLWGAIDTNGNWKWAPRFATLTGFSLEGDGAVRALASLPGDLRKKRLRLVDADGTEHALLKGTEARAFHQGRAAVRGAGRGEWAFVDTAGGVVSDGFSDVQSYVGTQAVVRKGGRGWAIVDREGGVVLASNEGRPVLGDDGTIAVCEGSGAAEVCTFTDAQGRAQAFPAGDALQTGFRAGLAVFVRGGKAGAYSSVEASPLF